MRIDVKRLFAFEGRRGKVAAAVAALLVVLLVAAAVSEGPAPGRTRRPWWFRRWSPGRNAAAVAAARAERGAARAGPGGRCREPRGGPRHGPRDPRCAPRDRRGGRRGGSGRGADSGARRRSRQAAGRRRRWSGEPARGAVAPADAGPAGARGRDPGGARSAAGGNGSRPSFRASWEDYVGLSEIEPWMVDLGVDLFRAAIEHLDARSLGDRPAGGAGRGRSLAGGSASGTRDHVGRLPEGRARCGRRVLPLSFRPPGAARLSRRGCPPVPRTRRAGTATGAALGSRTAGLGHDGHLLRGQVPRLRRRRQQRELQNDVPTGKLRRVDPRPLQFAAVHEGRPVGRVLALGVGHPERSREEAQVADEAVPLEGVVPVAEAADPRPFLAPLRPARLARQQARNQVAGDVQVGLAAQLARHVVEGDHLHAAAHVLQGARHLGEVPVARGEQDAVDVAGLEQRVDGHVEVAVGLAGAPAVIVDVPLDALDDDLVAEVAQRRLEASDVALVVLVRLGPPGIERRVGVEPQRVGAVAAGELAEDVRSAGPAPRCA